MRVTGRGWAVVAVVVVAVVMAAEFGPRGLNAVAVPGLVVLLLGVYRLRRIDQPALSRVVPDRATRGETVTVRLQFDVDRSLAARVRDAVGEGLTARGNERDVTLGDRSVSYELELHSRGRREVGPTEVTVTDELGLFSRAFTYPTSSRILVLPRIHPLAWAGRDELLALYGGSSDERREFDHLRHYERGDPVRDIHWKSSAKQPGDDLIVKTFADDQESRSVIVGGEASDGADDAMAEAVASIAVVLLETGVAVGIATPTGRIDPDEGLAHREALIDHLALCERGRLTERAREEADILVSATEEGVDVDLAGRRRSFADLSGRQLDADPASVPA